MAIELKKTVAVFTDFCSVEEAEVLLAWLLETPKGTVNLKAVTHLHTAVLQVLLYLKPKVTVYPTKPEMAWLNDLLA